MRFYYETLSLSDSEFTILRDLVHERIGLFYDNGKREVETSYWTPPDDALDSGNAMAPWARLAREAALRAGAKAASKKTRATTSGRPATRPRRTSP